MKYIYIITLALLVASCGPSEEETYVANMNVALDNGSVWKTDESTTTGVKNMRQIMRDFRTGGDDSLEAHQKLGDDLLAEFNTIFKLCQMEGEGHNQLHQYLMPVRKQISALKANDLAKAKEAAKTLNYHLGAYDSFFN